MANDLDIAWTAGLFEGEGCFTISTCGKSGYKQPRLKLSMVDRDVVKRFGDIVKLGHYCEQKFKNPLHSTQLCWYAGKRSDVKEIINLLLPYLGERRKARALELLLLIETN